MRTRRAVAAALWFVLALLVWNVRFDYGVRVSARAYLNDRALYLRGAGPRVEMASTMRTGIHDSLGASTLLSLPALGVAVYLAATRSRALARIPRSR